MLTLADIKIGMAYCLMQKSRPIEPDLMHDAITVLDKGIAGELVEERPSLYRLERPETYRSGLARTIRQIRTSDRFTEKEEIIKVYKSGAGTKWLKLETLNNSYYPAYPARIIREMDSDEVKAIIDLQELDLSIENTQGFGSSYRMFQYKDKVKTNKVLIDIYKYDIVKDHALVNANKEKYMEAGLYPATHVMEFREILMAILSEYWWTEFRYAKALERLIGIDRLEYLRDKFEYPAKKMFQNHVNRKNYEAEIKKKTREAKKKKVKKESEQSV